MAVVRADVLAGGRGRILIMAHNAITRARELEKRRRIRTAWFAVNGPCRKCGVAENLELDHVEPGMKVSHNVWSWTPMRRELELQKCQVLCRHCHRYKTSSERKPGAVLTQKRKIADKQVLKAVLLREMGWTTRKIGKKFGVSHVTISRLTNIAMEGKNFRHRGKLMGT